MGGIAVTDEIEETIVIGFDWEPTRRSKEKVIDGPEEITFEKREVYGTFVNLVCPDSTTQGRIGGIA